MSQSCVVRVRRHAITQAVTGLEVDDERAAQVAGRELEPCSRGAWCGPVWWRGPGAAAWARGVRRRDEDGALDWVAAALQFAEDNFNGLQPRDERSRHPSLGLRTDDSPSRRGEPRQDALPIVANPCASLHPTG
jgi:hypothetical protein